MEYLEQLKKSTNANEWKPELVPHLIDELRFFFQMLRVKLESEDPTLREAAAAEIKELRAFLEAHPLIAARKK